MPSTPSSSFPNSLGAESSNTNGFVRRSRRRLFYNMSNTSAFERPLPSYSDSGDPVFTCQKCSAFFWYGERVIRDSTSNRLVYKQCCKSGDVVLPPTVEPPPDLINLFKHSDFMDNIRAYNMMFAMTSFGAKVDESVNFGTGPYTFKISGQICHWLGSICPPPDAPPRFLQLFIYDTENEVTNRMRFFTREGNTSLDRDIVNRLSIILHRENQYVRFFKTASEIAAENNLEDFSVRLFYDPSKKQSELPRPGVLGAIVSGEDADTHAYDVIVHSRTGHPQRINRLHSCYMPLQYPLLFPFGEEGWALHMRQSSDGVKNGKPLTVNMYYSYVLHSRRDVNSLVMKGGRLLQQYMVDAYVCVEEGRLEFFRKNPNKFRSEFVSGVHDALSRGDSRGESIGKRIFLPSSFVGGPRYMYKHYQDALALCRVYGNPQYFITFTCNVRWPEFSRFTSQNQNQKIKDRPDLITRVFKMKVTEFIKFIREDRTFGEVCAYLYTIEFQKRGLPHCHTLIWVTSNTKIRDSSEVDLYISAEIPDIDRHPDLYSVVMSSMFHGPCGLLNPKAPCMRNGLCNKKFPKPFLDATVFDTDGYVRYKRNSHSTFSLANGIQIHNGFIVPYNRRLSTRFNAHINVEYCGWNMLIKYLFKYISKGVDRISFSIQRQERSDVDSSRHQPNVVDEIQSFIDGRFVCPHEAAWRIFNFPIHDRHPAVQILSIHLLNMQSTVFKDNTQLNDLVSEPSFGKTTLTSWFDMNSQSSEAHHLTYPDIPTYFRWEPSSKEWLPRTRVGTSSVGRLAYAHPTSGELFYLRMLLCQQKGCKSYEDVRTINGVVFPSFRLACNALGLIGDDREWLAAFNEASTWATSFQMRTLFCHLLLFCEVTDPLYLWENGWRFMGDDILRAIRDANPSILLSVLDNMVKEQILVELEKILNDATPPKSLSDFRLPTPSPASLRVLCNRLLLEEKSYDTSFLAAEHARMKSQLNSEQLNIYNEICKHAEIGKQLLIFVYGHGGTGKTFLWTTILAYFRSTSRVVLAVAASGIASLLLPAGRTAHSRLKIPIDLSETASCDIKKKTQLAELLKETVAIIWDEATMSDRKCFECVDRSFRDILDKPSLPFGGMTMLLGGDFRQTLPVKPKKKIYEVIDSTLPKSSLWRLFTIYPLTYNVRLSRTDVSPLEQQRLHSFTSWLLDIGDGKIGTVDPNNPETSKVIEIPQTLLLPQTSNCVDSLINYVYPNDVLSNPTTSDLSRRAIVCPKNETTNEINSKVILLTPGSPKTYLSNDGVIPHTHRMCDIDLLYPPEYLGQLNFSGFPLHHLDLKPNCPILLLRNLNQPLGLCNGTRMIVTQLFPYIIEATIVTGTSSLPTKN